MSRRTHQRPSNWFPTKPTCVWCRVKPSVFDRPMPGHSNRRLHLCDGCERVVLRQINKGLYGGVLS